MNLRPIILSDNEAIAKIIRNCLEEFGANKPGTVYFDDTTDHLFELFQSEKSFYYIVEKNNEILGGGGIFPTQGLPNDTCELLKMYLKPEARGKGYAKLLLQACEKKAMSFGFSKIYLESMPELKNALQLYKKMGFEYLPHALGNSGHSGCGLWMIKNELSNF